ncbi:nucleolar pre-ribosomal-associated protein 1-like isoform X4 [Manis javanica]|uniref:nucleolar pre-ribosomal-associated protein 1-like isoform X4 n=1 Tax=Manis javanica TaxID=9974 RepID=UPI003C6D4D58|nr:Nucleolar pre-ribosomal-associated protein 1 [Manis javanica]
MADTEDKCVGPGSPDLRHTDPQEEGPSGQDGAAKQARREELTGVRFKAQLRDPQGAGPALEAFVSAAKKLLGDDMYDVVEGYTKISVKCVQSSSSSWARRSGLKVKCY